MLQMNVGLRCNQSCRHCHLDAGPDRKEMMDRTTMEAIIAYARRNSFQLVDITGGAPELNPNLEHLIEEMASACPRVMLRSNLTVMYDRQEQNLIDLCRKHRVIIVASLPSLNIAQTEAQRGSGVWNKNISMLRKLNDEGYGHEGTGLELNLVSNPTGAFLPPSQNAAERKFKKDLDRKWGIVFNNLYSFANVPLGRFKKWLIQSGNFDSYMGRLIELFNPDTIDGLMCRTLVSVSWDGYLFDCDFNCAVNLYLGGTARHISEMNGLPEDGMPITTGDHCYACTAGTGFT